MNSTLFTDAMALTPAGDGVYDGELNEHWTIGPKVHGAAMLALCANAARIEHADGVEPIAVSGNSHVNEGSLYTVNLGAINDPGTDTVTQWTVRWGDGAAGERDQGPRCHGTALLTGPRGL